MAKNILLNVAAFLVAAVLPAVSAHAGSEAKSPAEYVNTTIGTKMNSWKSGYCVPGATRPFGMVQFSTPIANKTVGFGVNQINGGGSHMGNFPTLPLKGSLKCSPGHMTDARVRIIDEAGHAGYYTATVQDDIKAEMTATVRTGMARYTFPEGEEQFSVIIGAGISATRPDKAAMVITGPRSCEGYSDGGSFCGIRTPFKVYFAAEFDADAVESGVWKEDKLSRNADFAEGEESGVYFTFRNNGRPLGYKFGISYVSVENAKENLRAENPGWDFDSVRKDAEDEWNDLLSKIEVTGSNEDRKVQFYTHLYHVLINPNIFSDVNGEYPGSDFKTHSSIDRPAYTNFSNWDTYRTQIQLLSMLCPDVASGVVQSHLDFAEQAGGAFPRWVMGNVETGIMQGEPSTTLVANAWAFGARCYDPEKLFRIMLRGARIPGLKCQNTEVRPHLQEYIEKGYTNASLQLEYTSADFAIARFSTGACNEAFAEAEFDARARSWKNLYNPETGWLQCRDAEGNWRPFALDWADYDEASYKTYFWMVPYNLKGLIDIMGGAQAAEARLDELFRRLDATPFDDWYPSGNEPGFHIPWVYNWTGRPDKASGIINRILNEQYYVGVDGVPGNDDMGTMGAWYVFACMGMYPMIPGVGGFTLNTPVFDRIVMHLPLGDVVITGGSEKNIYTTGLTLDGKAVDRAWIDWEDIERGAALTYKTASKPGKWATAQLPPSYE